MNDTKYWLDGAPWGFSDAGQNAGTTKYWHDGTPMVEVYPTTAGVVAFIPIVAFFF